MRPPGRRLINPFSPSPTKPDTGEFRLIPDVARSQLGPAANECHCIGSGIEMVWSVSVSLGAGRYAFPHHFLYRERWLLVCSKASRRAFNAAAYFGRGGFWCKTTISRQPTRQGCWPSTQNNRPSTRRPTCWMCQSSGTSLIFSGAASSMFTLPAFEAACWHTPVIEISTPAASSQTPQDGMELGRQSELYQRVVSVPGQASADIPIT